MCKYLVENAHEPIIDRETFQLVQRIKGNVKPDRFQRIPAKPAERLHQNQVYFPFGAVSQKLPVTRAVCCTNAGCNVRVHRNKLPVWVAFDIIW